MPKTGMTAEEIQEKALASAMQRMRHSGFEKVRLVDIAKDLGVSHVALYKHFADKAALLDKISERWLNAIDESQERICVGEGNALEKIEAWFFNLHRAKRDKVRLDPELYKAFNFAAQTGKPFVDHHMQTAHDQLLRLVHEAMAANLLARQAPEAVVTILFSATMSFHHPRLVAEQLDIDREALLKQTLEVLFNGLKPQP